MRVQKISAIFLLLLLHVTCHARVINVDNDGPADFNTIQAAIDDANDGDVVIVQPGRYTGDGNRDIDFKGKAITVRSVDPAEWNIVEATIIDPNGSKEEPHCGFFFHEQEGPDSIASGFTITHGYGLKLTWGLGLTNIGGGICCRGFSSPTISYCVIKGNSAKMGGGICCVGDISPTIINCIIEENKALEWGGGINSLSSTPKFLNCTISNNLASTVGGGLYFAPKYDYKPEPVGGPTVENCIFWNNRVALYPEGDDEWDEFWPIYPDVTTVRYSNIKGGWPGEGNIEADPCFAIAGYWEPNETPIDEFDGRWITGDYHLKSQAGRWDPNSASWVHDDVTSPCIDAGDPMAPIGQEPFPNGGVINMGAYGGTAQASKSWFDKPVCETILAGDINGDCVVDFRDFMILARHWLEER